eukprot:scaffold45558_cov277-Skeletonema_marinoi.AAC.2
MHSVTPLDRIEVTLGGIVDRVTIRVAKSRTLVYPSLEPMVLRPTCVLIGDFIRRWMYRHTLQMSRGVSKKMNGE